METCKSPRKVLNAAYALAAACLKEHRSKFSRKDFTDPQLFACLVLREHLGRARAEHAIRRLILTALGAGEGPAEARLRRLVDDAALATLKALGKAQIGA